MPKVGGDLKMPRKRKTISELWDSGKWWHMGRVERRRRIRAEGLSVLSPGWPALPAGSDAKTSNEFNRLGELLAAECRLATTDGLLVLHYASVLASGDYEAVIEIDKLFRSRKPFPCATLRRRMG
jgi:hypothetical protein